MFAARHLRYEIYEKKQIQPLLAQHRRRVSRSTAHSESEHSLTASTADPRSPDTLGGAGPEFVGEASMFGCDDAQSDAGLVFAPLPDHNSLSLPSLDISLCRLSPSTLAAFTHSNSSSGPETHTSFTGPTAEMTCGSDVGTEIRPSAHSFQSLADKPLNNPSFLSHNDDCDEMAQSSHDNCATSSSEVSASLIALPVAAGSNAATADDSTQLTSVLPSVTQSTVLR